MSQTVVGLFTTPAEAEKVKQLLVTQGYTPTSIRVLSNESDGFAQGAVAEARGSGADESGVVASIKHFFHSLTGADSPEQDYYTRGVSSGGALLAVTVADDRTDSTAAMLETYGAQDVTEDGSMAPGQVSAKTGSANGGAIPIMKEEMQVGKRQVQRGGVRVYSQIVETPVEEDVRLREEHVRINRTPVNRAASAADFQAFKEGKIELTETNEEVVINKQARVVEEVTVGKDVTEHTQTIKDKLRHTEVNVEEIADESSRAKSAGKP